MRRLLILASTMVFLDVAFFAAIAPLLPTYVGDLGLSEAEAGILTGSYAAGTLLAALPAGLVAARAGPRRTAIVGLLLLGVASLAFGFAETIVLLDTARFCQGIAGALIWAGALTWLITTAPPERRGSVIGTALGMAVAGALCGPLLGATAAEVGTEAVFGGVLAVSVVLAAIAARFPEVRVVESQPLREVATAIAGRPMLTAAGFVAVPSLMLGAIEVLMPLRIDEFGGGHVLIAAAFVAAAATQAVLAPIAGHLSDRVGRRLPFVTGIGISAGAMVGIAFAAGLGPLVAALVLLAFGAGICFAPAMAMLPEAADLSRLHQGFAAGTSNMAWASGQAVGALAGGGLASLAGFEAPCLAVAALLVLTAIYARRALSPALVQPAAG